MSQPALTVMPLTRSRGQRLPPDDCTPDSPDARPVPPTAGTTAVAAAVRLWTARFRGNGGSGGGLAQRAEIWCSPIIRVAGVAGPAVRPSRAENYAAGNPHLVAKQARIGFAQALGGGLVAAIDGMRFVVPVPSAYARPNRKYSGGQRVKLHLRPQGPEITGTWTFSTLLRSLLAEDWEPWSTISVNGWILDPDRKKMSKSKGNVLTPAQLVEEFGADGLRYWCCRGAH